MLKSMVNLAKSAGLELGPLDRPVVKREDGINIKYVDYFGTDALREKFAGHEGRDMDDVVEIDYVLGEEKISTVVGEEFDYIVASHVFEHLPDPLGWLNDIDFVLRPNGSLFLAVPDKRFTFDIERPVTTLGELVDAFRSGKTRPSVKDVFDQHYYHAKVKPKDVWNLRGGRPDDLSRTFPPGHALALADRAKQAYIDCHCSVFTSASFCQIIDQLFQLKLQPFRVGTFVDVERPFNDFLCTLVRDA